jgi:hypothetical protein
MVFVAEDAIDRESLVNMLSAEAPYDLTFMFVATYGSNAVKDKFLVVEGGKKVFADDRYVNEMEGVTLVDTSGRELGEVMAEGKCG